MSQHTPGPWQRFHEADGSFSIGNEDFLIATVDGDSPEPQANSAMIAASPTMYEALKVALAEMSDPEIEGALLIAANHGYVGTEDGRNLHGRRRATVRAAIAKAEGK